MKHKIPIVLIYSRLAIGLLLIVFSLINIDYYKAVAVILLTIGLLTDIFDGIIARQLNISTQKLRRLDSTIDQLFFIAVVVATYIQCNSFFIENVTKLIILISIEALTYLVSFIKFKKEIATHTIGAKIWTLILFATLIQIILQCQSTLLFDFCFYIGIITRLEIIAIILALKNWTNDVPSFYHALRLRNNKAIKRNKLLNG
jgi:phosphatidylglycerophosphate synthase